MVEKIKHLGIDAGSVSVKAALIESDGSVLDWCYVRHYGRPLAALDDILSSIGIKASTVSVTGSAGKLLGSILAAKPVNELVAQATATLRLFPHIQSIIEMGGEDSKLIVLSDGKIKDFSMNAMCAAGTGSFLDQQAERLRLSIEEFSKMALGSKNPPRIAGRCSVFAKSDMIHLQQIATPVEDIVAGLCFAVARNFKSSICKGRNIDAPVAFQGGVAANEGMVRAFKEIFELDELVRPEHHALMGAIGAVLSDLEKNASGELDKLATFNPQLLEKSIKNQSYSGDSLNRLLDDDKDFWSRHTVSYPIHRVSGPDREKAYLGIDIGSISTNLAVVDSEGHLLAKRYLRTAGRPIEAVMTGLEEVASEIGDKVEICGLGTTGSGRYMIADYVGADIVKNEITAQATAAAFIDPNVDTIFEIGGQDSKYIGLKDGVVVDFEMNKACAAGTGSFLEEQAEKLSVSVKEEFAQEAMCADAPCPLGERCTVFMENSLMSRLQKGAGKRDLLAGLSYSIVKNYLNRVVGDRRIGKNIFFQGGTAFNKSVVAAFEKVLGLNVTVPPHHDVTGAIGMALIAMRSMTSKGNQTLKMEAPKSRFKGFDLWKRSYSIKSFECKSCDNLCEINTVTVEGEKQNLIYGGRCEKYDIKRNGSTPSSESSTSVCGTTESQIPNLFEERATWLFETHRHESKKSKNRKEPFKAKLGLPLVFFFNEFLPFWSHLLWKLGFDVVLSPETNTKVIHSGLEVVQAETCYPVKVAHGHIKYLLDEGVDAVFVPSMIGLNSEDEAFSRAISCPYVQTIPYMSSVALGRYPAVVPIVDFEQGQSYLVSELYRTLKQFGVRKAEIKRALPPAWKSQREFQAKLQKRGRSLLENLSSRAVVVVGRAYNAFDPAMNLNIPKKLIDLEVLPIPMDFLPLHEADITDEWSGMYWRSGQRLLQAAKIIKDNSKLFPIFITNFSCGPDSFILKFFKEKLSGKPFLQLEIDEHSADAGAVTRCEAFLDSLENLDTDVFSSNRKTRKNLSGKKLQDRNIYVPRMCDHTLSLTAAFQACGMDAETLPLPDSSSTEIGRKYVSGKECYPYTVTTGDMIKKVMEHDFEPDKSAFFMPSGTGPCRFGQYNTYQRLILDELDLENVPIVAPVQEAGFYKEMGFVGSKFVKLAMSGIVATDFLLKCLHETRPYEKNEGETYALYEIFLEKVGNTVKGGNGIMPDLMKDAGKEFSRIQKYKDRKPLVGLVGEIYVRSNVYSNENLVRKIEEAGGEVWLSPISEWFLYLNHMGINLARQKKQWGSLFTEYMTRRFQYKIEHQYANAFNGNFRTLHELPVNKLLRLAYPYIDESFEGEAILSVAKAVDLVARGASGVINAMPFGCMPGNIAGAILKAVKEDYGLPYLNIAYDGTESTTMAIQLEAFMHQVKSKAAI